jgi:radical SAM superfamily enzyme YgiQ (UPF0313 family)
MSAAEVEEALDSFSPQVVGISALTLMWPKAAALARRLKEGCPSLRVVAGGVHPSLIRQRALEEVPELDAVFWGEGEESVREYLRLREGGGEGAIPGVAHRRRDGGIAVGPDRPPLADLDSLPVPDRRLLHTDPRRYVPAIEQYRRLPVTSMVTARGCPHRCLFCLPDLLGAKVRLRSPQRVLEEVDYLVRDFGIRDIAFWDDTFTLDRERVLAVCEGLTRRGLPVIWSAQARADRVDREMLRAMRRSGCWKLFFGIESLVQRNLDTLGKGERIEQIREAVALTAREGIETEGSFIFGIPGETYREGLETIRGACGLDLDYAKFFFFTPYGALQEELADRGTFVTRDPSAYHGNAITFVPAGMSREELEDLHRRAYRRFYLRPAALWRRLRTLADPLERRKTLRGAGALGRLLLARSPGGRSR